MRNDFYNYQNFSDERLKEVMLGWDGLGGLHGLMIKECGDLLMGTTVLDVGCGLCHLYEYLKGKITDYCGLDNNKRVLNLAKQRYPQLNLRFGDVYNLNFGMFDSVFAIGLYNHEPLYTKGLKEMNKCSKKCVILTYRHKSGLVMKFAEDHNLFFQRKTLDDIWIVRLVKNTTFK